MVCSFDEFVNEELNIQSIDGGLCKFEDRWFYYDPDDDIIYGSDTCPNDVADGFAFNPVKGIVVVSDSDDFIYGNDSLCLISYNMDSGEVRVFTDESLVDWFDDNGIVLNGDEPDAEEIYEIYSVFNRNQEDGMKYILIRGNLMIASTFDVIEEN